MKRRLLPTLMTLVLVCALPIWAAFVTSGDVTNPLLTTAEATSSEESAADKLKRYIESGVNVQLTEDIEISTTLAVTRDVTLDLNGYVLKMTGEGSVLCVKKDGPNSVTLTIKDSNDKSSHTGAYEGLPAGGVIIGGQGTYVRSVDYVGGAVYLEDGTTLKLEGGTLTGSHSRGSVFIGEGAAFVMSGGTITGETIGVRSLLGSFTMTGGRITGCYEQGVYMYNGNMTVSGTAYIGGNPGAREDIYVYESDHKHTDLSVTGGTIAGNVRIVFLESLHPTQDNLKAVANSVVKEQGVFDGHIQVRIDKTEGTGVDYNTVNFIGEVAKTRTLKLVLQPNAVEEPETPATVNGQAFKYWATKGSSEAWNFETKLEVPLTLYAVRTPASSGGYYYTPPAEQPIEAPKTADPGIALYAALSLLSLTALTRTPKAFPLRGPRY